MVDVRIPEKRLREIGHLVDRGYVRVAKHPAADLYIYNYTQRAEIDEMWTPETRMCRGLVLNGRGEVIIRCIEKFFNRGTKFAVNIDFDNCRISEKNDGYMMQIQRSRGFDLDGELLITSRGSFDNKYVNKTRELIKNHIQHFEPNYTYVCELCCDFPGDESIIVTRHPVPRLICFAVTDDSGKEISLDSFELPPCLEKVKFFTPDEASKYLKGEVEGVVLQDKNNNRVKVKTDWFLARHRVISNCTKKHVWETLKDGRHINDLSLPDELLPQMKKWEGELNAEFERKWQKVLSYYALSDGLSKKEVALSDEIPREYKPLVLSFMTGKEGRARDNLWKRLRPGGAK